MEENVKIPFWQKTWIVVLACIFIPPAGIALLWVGKKGGKSLRIILTVILALYSLSLLGGTFGGGTSKTQIQSQTNTEISTTENSAAPNSSAKVDEIYKQARNDASSINSEKRTTAVNYIRDNYPNYFKDNTTMEQTMYYGALLENAYDHDSSMTDYANLGLDAYQVVKYVYRGAETTESDSVTANLSQIQKSLNLIQN